MQSTTKTLPAVTVRCSDLTAWQAAVEKAAAEFLRRAS